MNLPTIVKEKTKIIFLGSISIVILLFISQFFITSYIYRLFFESIFIVFGFLITNILSKNTIKGNIFRLIRNIFGDFGFKSFVVIDFASWIYFLSNVAFWAYIPRLFLLSELEISSKFSTVGLALLSLIVLRVFLESSIALMRIAENTSK